MHRIHNAPRAGGGPETAGRTIHWAAQYDLMTSLMGLGVHRPNSRMIVEMARIEPGDKVLDVACGTGSLTLTAGQAAGESGSVHGIDASSEMIEAARKKAQRSSSSTVFEVGLIEKLGYPDATLDVVISRLAIHHLPDELKRQGFREVLRVLKPGGRLFVADFRVPDNPVLAHVTSALVGHGMMAYGISVIPPMLVEAGFVDVASGPTRSAFLAFVSGRRPAS